ncbi:hypothetical protein CAC42_7483 [Sphaceloma murrayae]|uniref:Uncharacterized protein n=1 Tax=Sphaceloma murrayae TaxID=2082308 RepID=A0A2K1QXA1_9PEZI|nr:hypothetical protein CAC42_7483 [Sphaceloma murrayae]
MPTLINARAPPQRLHPKKHQAKGKPVAKPATSAPPSAAKASKVLPLIRNPKPLQGREQRDLLASIVRPRPFPFLRLPVELRHMVYHHVDQDFTDAGRRIWFTYGTGMTVPKAKVNKEMWNLVLTGPEIREEVLPYLYAGRKFGIHLEYSAPKVGLKMPGLEVGLVADLAMRVSGATMGWVDGYLKIQDFFQAGEHLDKLEVEIHRPRKKMSEDRIVFVPDFKDLLAEWKDLKVIRRVNIRGAGMNVPWFVDQLEVAENERLHQMHPEKCRTSGGNSVDGPGEESSGDGDLLDGRP